jgi:hypothetical protein
MDDSKYICPRCRRPGKPRIAEVYPKGIMPQDDPEKKTLLDTIYAYPCGSSFSTAEQKLIVTVCGFKPIKPEEALREAEMVREALLCEDIVHTAGDEKLFDIPKQDFSCLRKRIKEDCRFLLWDADVLMSVMNQAESFIGTRVPYTIPMNQIWIIDPAIQNSADDTVLGIFFDADQGGLQQVQLAAYFGEDYDANALAIWQPFYKWGNEIKSIEHAKWAAVYTWLQQPYVVQAEGIKHSRQVKREAERKKQKLPSISVIEFRRPECSRSGKSIGEKTRELHCCFERAGHTRRQPYGRMNSLRRVQWIAPTFVGDPEKPFKPKGQKIYKVTR